ncbi:DNA-binding protein H-NS [Vibrio astriarenae]|nr:DNA-binding protein H-NS [Vibrio sp. C7]
MSELSKVLLNIRSLRAFSRDLTLDQLEEALNKLTVVVEERQAIEEQKKENEAERLAQLESITQQISQTGINVEELINALSGQTNKKPISKRSPRPAKYKYTNHHGQEKTWTGQGRTPSPIQEYLNEGGELEDFLIG